jgi:hypothetical protein
MTSTAVDPNAAVEPMAPDLAARVTAFARATRAAARSVALYPGEHPAVAAALGALTDAAREAASSTVLRLEVLPDTLMVNGRAPVRPDAAISDFAAILHRHMVGQLSIHPLTDADLWKRFVALLALPPDQAQLRGGLGKLWASEGETRIELRILDYAELLRAGVRGDAATWETIVASCLGGHATAVDEALVDLLFGVLNDPGRISSVVRAVDARLPAEGTQAESAMVIAELLQAVAQFVSTSTPEQVDNVMSALAEAATRLPVETLAPIVEARGETSRPGLAQFVQGLLQRISDGSIADLVACEVRAGRGASPRLADAFCGLAPAVDRRSAILALARNTVVQTGGNADPALAQAWQQSEQLLLAYSDKAFVSDAYDTELKRLADRAVDLDKDRTDPPERISAWCGSVDDNGIRLLDSSLLADLMRLQQDAAGWHDLADLVLDRLNFLVVVGDFHAAALLVEALRSQSLHHDNPGIRTAAQEALNHVLTRSTMRHVASHLDTADQSVVQAALRFCLSMGTQGIDSLSEVLSREARSRPRKHLIDILVSFGAAGRQSVEQLRQSPNAAVRRTAVLLLRKFGGQEALPELESLLSDAEPHVQREATRAIAMLGGDAAYAMLIRALARGTGSARSGILGVLWSLPDEDAEQILSYLVVHAPHRGAMWPIRRRAIERLGSRGGRLAVDALAAVLASRQIWSPFRMMAMHRAAVDALAHIGTPDAVAELEAIALDGPRWVRAATRARLDAGTAAPARERPQR